MIATQRQRLIQGRIRSMLARKLGYSVDEVLKRVLENEMYETAGYRLSQMANAQAKKTGNSIYFAHKDLFQNKGQAQQLAVSYYSGHWGAAMHKKLVERKYYKTPGGSIVFIPEGEITHFNEDGAVYSIRVSGTEYFWKYTEDIYCDIYQNIYDPYGELSLGSKPRYVRAAFRKFLEVKLRHPDAYMTTVIGNNAPEMMINYFDAASSMVMGFSGTYYDGKSFNEMNYPEVGTGEGVIPLWGSGMSAYYDFQDGDYGWAGVNTIMAISDVFLVKSIFKGISQGGLKAFTMGNKPWSHREFWDPTKSYSGFYHSSGFAASGQHIHHSLLMQNLGIGKYTPNFIKHQMFGLNPIKGRWINGKYFDSAAMHRAIHGKNKDLMLNTVYRYYYGTPYWVKPFGISTTGRGINSIFKDD